MSQPKEQTMETFKNLTLLCLAGFTGLFVLAMAMGDNARFSKPATRADTIQRECIDEKYRLLLKLTDKPWRTSELVYEARKLCN
jgi:hypothetical protein